MQEGDPKDLEPLTLAQHAELVAKQPHCRGRVVETVLPVRLARARVGVEQETDHIEHAFAELFVEENDAVFSAKAGVKAFAHVKVPKP
jgi:hypothetical protein